MQRCEAGWHEGGEMKCPFCKSEMVFIGMSTVYSNVGIWKCEKCEFEMGEDYVNGKYK